MKTKSKKQSVKKKFVANTKANPDEKKKMILSIGFPTATLEN